MGIRGPAPIQINWVEFDRLASYHCTQREIADFFSVSVDTLERACLRDHGMKLAELFEQKKGAGRGRLRKIQWNIAEAGSTVMAIYLGKVVLGQSDQPLDEGILAAAQEAGITRDEAIQIILNASATAKVKHKKTFEEFCVAAGYPAPFPKQVEMMRFAFVETVPRMILGARGYGKTDYITILGTAYDIYVNGLKTSNLIISKSKSRNAAMIQEIASALLSNGVALGKQNSTCIRIAGLVGKDHSVEAITIKTSMRGRHPERILMDDPVTEEDVSESMRALVKRKYDEAIKLCSNVGVIGQPAHKFDLYAGLRDLLKKMEIPHGEIPELDHDLEAQRLAGVDEASIQASYFLKIISEGTTPFDNIKYLDEFPTGDSVAFIDPASEGTDSTAISIFRAHMQGVAVVGFKWRKAWNHCLDDMAPILMRFGVRKLAFETNSLGDQPIEILRKVFPGVGVVGRKSVTNKHSSIMAAGSFSHMIHLSRQSSAGFTKEVIEYEYGAKHDDAPDTIARGLEWIGLIRGKQ